MNAMVNILLVLALLLSPAASTMTNTTEFWRKQLGLSEMHYQAYSGFEEIDWFYQKGSSGMFYTLFTAMGHSITEQSEKVPLIIWLQGGPGASSQFGAFTEVGPIRIVKGQAKEFQNAWSLMGHTVFVDQPLNVGFSWQGADRNRTTDQVRSAVQAGQHLLNFLWNLYRQWPALKKSPLFITGQSFAGHYIPAFANAILENDTFVALTGVKLEGVAIGDGWTDPINQVNYYDSFLYSAGIVSNKWRDTATWFQTQAIQNIYRMRWANATTYFDFLTNNDTTSQAYWGGISIFNFRQYDPMDESFADFLQKNKAQLGVSDPSLNFIPGNDRIYQSFENDIPRSYAHLVVNLLKRVRVLIYNGQNDFVVNTAGVLTYLNGLNWVGVPQWKRTRKEIWTIHGEVKGWAKVAGNLWFAFVNKAGHMVPTDQPQAAFNLLGHFIYNQNSWKQ